MAQPFIHRHVRMKCWRVHSGIHYRRLVGGCFPVVAPCGYCFFPNPTSVYGATKLAQEHILAAWCGAMQVPLSVFRLQNVYGPGQSPFNSYTGIITLFHRMARKAQTLEIYEDGEIGRDFVFIDDVVVALMAGLRQPPAGLRTLDVGSGVVTTIAEAAKSIAAMHGAPDPQISGKFRDGDVRWAVADGAPLEQSLGVQARINFSGRRQSCRRVADRSGLCMNSFDEKTQKKKRWALSLWLR